MDKAAGPVLLLNQKSPGTVTRLRMWMHTRLLTGVMSAHPGVG